MKKLITVKIELEFNDVERHNSTEKENKTIWKNYEYDIEIEQTEDRVDNVKISDEGFFISVSKEDIIKAFNDAINTIHKQDNI